MIVMELIIVGITKLVEIVRPAIKNRLNKSKQVAVGNDVKTEQNAKQAETKGKNE